MNDVSKTILMSLFFIYLSSCEDVYNLGDLPSLSTDAELFALNRDMEPGSVIDFETFGGPNDAGMGGTTVGSEMGESQTFLTFTRVYREAERSTRADLIVFDFLAQNEIWLNEGISTDDLDCLSSGCFLHPTLSWVAWLQPNQGQSDLYIAPINRSESIVDIGNKRKVGSNVLHFDFTNTKIVYTEIKNAEAANGVAVKVAPLDGSEAGTEVDLVSANGGFATTLNDDLLIIIKTTLSSMNISFLNIANGEIFELFTFGESGGTGSDFSTSSNPVRFAPDSTYLVAVTNNEFMWRVHTLEATDEIVMPVTRDLFPIRNVEEACTGNYPFISVVNEPIFTNDSEHFYLLFNGDCSIRQHPASNRQDYEIYRFSRDLSQLPVNVTQVPRGNHWSNHDIRNFAISPDETKLAFTASRPNSNGNYSIWIMNLGSDGTATGFDCSRHAAILDINGVSRCEYLVYNREGSAEYKNLMYHSAVSF